MNGLQQFFNQWMGGGQPFYGAYVSWAKRNNFASNNIVSQSDFNTFASGGDVLGDEGDESDGYTLDQLKQKLGSDFDLSSLTGEQIATAFGFEDSDYAEFFGSYDPWKAEYREQQYNKRWGSGENSLYNLRKQKLGTQKQQSLGKLNLQQKGIRQTASNSLFDLGRQQRGKAAQSGFSNSGGLLSAQNQQRDRIMSNLGLQRQQIGLEREGIKTRYSQGISQLDTQRGLADIGYLRDIEGYERDWFERLTQRATNLIQSGADYE